MVEARRPPHNGWLWFAALVMFLDGSFNIVDGLVAIFKHGAYGQGTGELVVFNFTAWGWIMVIIGAVQVVVSFALRTGAMWARLTALGILLISAMSQIFFITVAPFWSIVIIAIDILVMWAILVYVPQGDT